MEGREGETGRERGDRDEGEVERCWIAIVRVAVFRWTVVDGVRGVDGMRVAISAVS